MSAQLGLGLLTVDAFERSAPVESDRWATTDRGWLYDPAHPDLAHRYVQVHGNCPVGNYLDYGPCGEHYQTQPEGAIHACFTPWRVDTCVGKRYGVTQAQWFHTVEQAQTWLGDMWRAWVSQ